MSGWKSARQPSIASKTALQLSELDQATAISEQLVRAVGGREQAPIVSAAQAQVRQRNFTLFARAYDQVRRAITFLHWVEDDGTRIPTRLARRSVPRSPWVLRLIGRDPDPAKSREHVLLSRKA